MNRPENSITAVVDAYIPDQDLRIRDQKGSCNEVSGR